MDKIRIVFEDSQSSLTCTQRCRNAVGKVRDVILGSICTAFIIVIIVIIVVATTKKGKNDETQTSSVLSSSTSVLSGSTSVLSGSTSVLSGSTSVLSGSTSVLSGSTSVLSGSTSVLSGSTSVLSGSTSVLSGSTSVLSGSTTTTTTTTTDLPAGSIHCMFVGDVLNLDNDTIRYGDQKAMIDQVANLMLNPRRGHTARFWAYGHVRIRTNFQLRFNNFTEVWNTFAGYTLELMKFDASILHPPGGNDGVFLEINKTGDTKDTANCLVFLSAMTNVEGYEIKPEYIYYKRIVVVSLAGGDFSSIIDRRGVVVEISPPYNTKKNAKEIYDAIVKGF